MSPASLKGYSVSDVAGMIGLSPRQIRDFARSGLLSPRRGRRNEYRFSFQDLVILRTAKGLIDANIPAARVREALQHLEQQLPRGRPITGVQIFADGKEVVVQQGDELWEPESGQALFNFEVASLAEKAAPLARRAAAAARDVAAELGADDWFELGCELELTTPDEARDAYRRALELEPRHADAHLNLGRLLHDEGEVPAAAEHYRRALESRPGDATALFNLGVALQDLGRRRQAITAYEATIDADPDYADAYFNLSGLYEQVGEPQLALRHFKTYKKLVGA